jgi:hypothetical protein
METRIKTGYIADPRGVVQAAVGAFSANQHLAPEMQAAAIFVAFSELCGRLGIEPGLAYDRGVQIARNGDLARERSALRDFIDNEIRDPQ